MIRSNERERQLYSLTLYVVGFVVDGAVDGNGEKRRKSHSSWGMGGICSPPPVAGGNKVGGEDWRRLRGRDEKKKKFSPYRLHE
jgi:hypothetical protein